MASNLACVGLASASSEELSAVVAKMLPRSISLGKQRGLEVRRWEDSSGARMVLGIRDGSIVEFLPSLASKPGARLARIAALSDEVSTAAVVDEAGDQLTSVAVEFEERALLTETARAGGAASIVALGQAVTIHDDSAAFAASRESLLDPSADLDAPAPAVYAERGLKWPPRMASESFIAHSVFPTGAEPEATARLNGVVLHSDRRVNTLTGQAFVVARVRTIGFEADVCLPGSEHSSALRPGQIVAGTVFLAASLATVASQSREAPKKRRWWRWSTEPGSNR